jgi:hypothetical protein
MGGSRLASEDHCVGGVGQFLGENSGDFDQGPELTLGSHLMALLITGLRILCGVEGRLEQTRGPHHQTSGCIDSSCNSSSTTYRPETVARR